MRPPIRTSSSATTTKTRFIGTLTLLICPVLTRGSHLAIILSLSLSFWQRDPSELGTAVTEARAMASVGNYALNQPSTVYGSSNINIKAAYTTWKSCSSTPMLHHTTNHHIAFRVNKASTLTLMTSDKYLSTNTRRLESTSIASSRWIISLSSPHTIN